MSINVLNIPYTYTVPTLAKAIDQTKNKMDPDTIEKITQGSINDVYEKYLSYFNSTNGTYTLIKNNLLERLNSILETDNSIEELDTDTFYSNAQTFLNESDTYRIDKDHCREGFMAYRFYLKEIATRIKTIDNYIKEGQSMLDKLANLSGSSEQVNNFAHEYITQLEIYDKFIYEELKEFLTYYKFNEDTKQWDITIRDVFATDDFNKNYAWSQLGTYDNYKYNKKYYWDGNQWTTSQPSSSEPEKIPTIESKLQNLRALKVNTTKSKSNGDPGEGSMQLTSFNSLTLFDRLKYIRWYYNLMFSQAADSIDRTGSRFPDNNDTGYPCMPDIPSIDPKKATKSLGALELFYVGYLINRDGPVNALSSFFEVKVNALRENVSLSSKKIEALNIYLDFINVGLEQVNKNSSQRPSNGSIIALTYLCGQNMYNLFEDGNGGKYLVLPSLVNQNTYFLVKANENGKQWLVGNCNYTNPEGNCRCSIAYSGNKGLWYITNMYTNSENDTALNFYDSTNSPGTLSDVTFKLPTQIECTEVAPSSVKGYSNATEIELETNSNNNVMGSWTDAFSRKTQFINTAIDTINTDVTLDRSKIDTFDSLTSTFRSRAQDTYQNILSNVR